MRTLFKGRFLKSIALFFAFNILLEVFFPTLAWALTDGPKQPEYSGFEPVATTNMVSDFSGAFTYNLPVVNIPGPNGSGYAMSLSYHSGNNSESEASWVGHGWTLNPGAINRNLQGVPDDYNGDNITFYNKRKPNITTTVGKKLGVEAYSIDLSADFSYSYNNYRGFGSKLALGLGVGYGLVSLGYSVSGQEPGSFTASSNPGAIMKIMDAAGSKKVMASILKDSDGKISQMGKALKEKINETADNMKSGKKKSLGRKALDKLGSISFGINSNSFNSVTALNNYSANCFSLNFEYTNGIDPSLLHIGFEMGYRGSLSYMENESFFDIPKKGLLYDTRDDYSVEKENPYNLRDRYLPIPHKGKDQFVITGEMLNGGFSLVDPGLTQSQVATQNNSVKIFNAGLDVNVGLNIGVGANVGLGLSTSQVSSFDYTGFSATGVKPYFRFNNDIGGNVVFSNSVGGATSTHSFTSSIVAPTNDLNSSNYGNMNVNSLSQRQGQVGFIGYSTFDDRTNPKIYSANKDLETIALATTGPGARISDIYSVNDEGSKLIYGLPVFVKDESQISEDVLERGNLQEGVPDVFIKTNNSVETQLGQKNSGIYATSYLLTQINTSDYIDRTLNGPSDDDFGGWTRFTYRNPAYVATSDKNYRYRSPYVGLSYQQGELTDKDDDLGSCQSGTKEMYYLKYIETKTHIAFFITNKTNTTYKTLTLQGSGTDRHDGIEAPDNDDAKAGGTSTAQKRAEYLEKIVVYSKNDLTGKPLSVVNFAYDVNYSLSPGVLNHQCSVAGCNKGKLTLSKVWFEYEGVVNAKIAPYEFKYSYKLPTEFKDQDLKTKYNSIIQYGSTLTSTDQNPAYKTWALDGWGSYRSDGRDRTLNKEPWMNQFSDAHFDPAAWQLKQIKLPTGGEILIQYEQHDYRYVQDQPALSMVKLAGTSSDLIYTLDPLSIADLVVTGDPAKTSTNKTDYVKQLNAYLSKEKIYFRFLYSLYGDGDVNSLQNCANEYITGFANANAVLDGSGNINIQINENSGSISAPKDVCKWFAKRKVAGKPLNSDCNYRNIDLFFPDNKAQNDLSSIASKVVAIVSGAKNLLASDFGFANSCANMSITHSFFRVPVFKSKKAGGVRVKRILMYDQGIEAVSGTKDRDEVLYGTEYFYQDVNGLSSGVATNEPNAFREENALVRALIQRNDPTWKQKMMSGVDRETFEGPLGEQLLPPPSIGYSRVVTQNIHSGKSNTGYKITEYATCKDYPFKAKNSSVRAPGSDKYTIPAIIVMIDVERRAAAQSYEFLINDMHGKLKSIKTFRGSYDLTTHQDDKSTFSEIHDYYKLDEKVKVMDATGAITDDYMGKEETITFENRHAKDEYMGMSTQFDMSVGLNFPPPVCIFQFSGMGYVGYSLKEFRTAVFNKTISITGVAKSITTTSDGITRVQDFKVFNKYNGQPVVTDTYDGYNGLVNLPYSSSGPHTGTIRTHKVPAHYVYCGMGQKVKNEQLTFSGKIYSSSLNKLTVTALEAPLFTEGDLLALSAGTNSGLFYVDSKTGNDLMLVKMNRHVGLGSAVADGPVNVKIINSGYTNQLSSDAATIITYGNSATIGSSSEVYDGTTSTKSLKSVNDVLSASVSLYSNNWVSSVVRNGDTNDDDYSLGMKGKWRMKSQVVFNSTIKDAFDLVTNDKKVYNKAGTFPMLSYTYGSTSNSDKWIVSSLFNTYSSGGMALEDQNALGVKSSADSNSTVPGYIAKNAPFGSCIFKSYENQSTASTDKAHTGKKSNKLQYNMVGMFEYVSLDAASKQKDLLIRFWLNSSNSVMEDINKNISLSVRDVSFTSALRPKITKIAQVGEWTLYEAVARGLNNYTDNDFVIQIDNIAPNTISYLDDFRVQPNESEMMCYVYDAYSLRLVATFDDQHFALLYQYNGEGKLVRKLVETERGTKTISETQYNVPKRLR